ncbi:MAG TPA: helix-turn-helix transcriptional regulator [Cyanophyceae cyanobacterium]
MHSILAKRIREIRLKAQLRQENFARLCRTTSATVSRWESGRSEPRARHLKAIANIAGITVDELLSEEESWGAA